MCERAADEVVCILPCVACACFSGAGKASVAVAADEDVGFIPVHGDLGRRLDEDIDFATRLLEELLDFGHGASMAELIAMDGKVDPFVIDARDVSREERDSAAELRVRNGDEVGLARHEDALDEDFASLQLLRLGGESADGEPGEESGERARDCVLHRGGHAWNCFACLVVLRFYFFSLPTAVAVFSFNFFDRKKRPGWSSFFM